MVSADSHESSEEADRPQRHDDDPYDDVRAIFGSTEGLEIEE
jgi:hypothetical protein